MSELLNEALRQGLRGDWLGALDYAESLYRGLNRDVSVDRLGISEAEYGILKASAEAAYNALCAGRVILDGNA